MKRWLILAVLILLIVVSVLTIFVYLKNNDYSKNIESYISKSNTSKNYYESILGEDVKFGIYPKEESNGLEVVSVYGTLESFEKDNEEYKIVINTGNNLLKFNIGKEDFAVTNLYGKINSESGSIVSREGDKVVVEEIYENSTAKKIFDTYKDYIGSPFRIDIISKISNENPAECDEICRERLKFYLKYKKENRELREQFSEPKSLLGKEFGFARLVSVSK